jgi:hypothetical protein
MGMGRAQTPALEAKFAIEVPGINGIPPSYVPVGAGSSLVLYEGHLHRLANAGPGIRKPSAIKLEYKADGDMVTIAASAYYGEVDLKTTPISVETLESEALGSYSGKLNDSVTISAMEQAGLEPMTIKIVTAQTDNPYHPPTRSNAPSLRIDYSPENRVFGLVTVHNLSNKAVTAVHLGSLKDGDIWNMGEVRGVRDELIAPGASYQIRVYIRPRGRLVKGSNVEKPLPGHMTLGAVLFADGSYEGDRTLAAGMVAHQIGRETQQQRILSLTEPILAQPELDDNARAERIRIAVKQLPEDPDAKMIDSLRAQFPKLSDSGVATAQTELSSGMKNEKERFDSCIKNFDPTSSPEEPNMSLEHWLDVSYAK